MRRFITVFVFASLALPLFARAQGRVGDETAGNPSRHVESVKGTPDYTGNAESNSPQGDEELRKKVEELKDRLDAMDETVKEIGNDRDALKKIKISGYLQVNFEKSENRTGLATDPYDSRDYVKGRFRIRRSRIKVQYDGKTTTMVIQGDYTNAGITLKDAYLEFAEPWLNLFSLRFGVFNRPVFEVETSSSVRESPERSRVIQVLYPGERDLGAMLTVKPMELFQLQLAVFNNTFKGTFSQQSPNFGSEPLYLMGRLTKSFVLGDIGLDLGVHGRVGNVRANTSRVLESDRPTNTAPDSVSVRVGDAIPRNWFGVEAQLYYDFLGGMKLIGEYILGSDVNELSSSGGAIRKRDFNGFYAMLVKNIGTDFQVALKYDSYNPNAAIGEDVINDPNELRVDTFGFGLLNYTFPNVRLTLWYDVVSTKTNERILKVDPKDNLLNFRAQYKF